jgi:hypothetical protein
MSVNVKRKTMWAPTDFNLRTGKAEPDLVNLRHTFADARDTGNERPIRVTVSWDAAEIRKRSKAARRRER